MLFDCLIGSPPWVDGDTRGPSHAQSDTPSKQVTLTHFEGKGGPAFLDKAYGTTAGQLGAMRPGQPEEQTMTTRQVEVQTWAGCYNSTWKGAITPLSFSHPAKCSRGLLCRILDFLLSEGWLKRGSTLLDCFSGVATTAIEGASRGLRCIGVELEEKFHLLALRNMELHRRTWATFGDPHPILLQGDSRDLVRVLGAAGLAGILSSPPYAGTHNQGGDQATNPGMKWVNGERSDRGKVDRDNYNGTDYGTTEGQLTALPPGDPTTASRSPPYHDALTHDGQKHKDGFEQGQTQGKDAFADGYGNTPGQLQEMPAGDLDAVVSEGAAQAEAIVSSPPHMSVGCRGAADPTFAGKFQGNQRYSDQDAKDPARTVGGDRNSEEVRRAREERARTIANLGEIVVDSGATGLQHTATFWSAARTILQQCHAVLRPGSPCVWICKDFVRDGRRVRFSEQWARLCQSVGFELFLWVKASLVSEERAPSLFGGDEVKRKKKVNFFRRIHERKLAEDDERRIDHEDVIFLRKREGI